MNENKDADTGVVWTDKNRLPMWVVFLFVRPLKASLSAVGGLFVANKIFEEYTGKGLKNFFFYVGITFVSTFLFNFFINGGELVGRYDWIGTKTQ